MVSFPSLLGGWEARFGLFFLLFWEAGGSVLVSFLLFWEAGRPVLTSFLLFWEAGRPTSLAGRPLQGALKVLARGQGRRGMGPDALRKCPLRGASGMPPSAALDLWPRTLRVPCSMPPCERSSLPGWYTRVVYREAYQGVQGGIYAAQGGPQTDRIPSCACARARDMSAGRVRVPGQKVTERSWAMGPGLWAQRCTPPCICLPSTPGIYHPVHPWVYHQPPARWSEHGVQLRCAACALRTALGSVLRLIMPARDFPALGSRKVSLGIGTARADRSRSRERERKTIG